MTDNELEYFNQVMAANHISPIVVHIPYICNPASINEDIYNLAYEIIAEELQRCKMINADYLVLHPGAYTTSSPAEGIRRVSNLLNRVLDPYAGETLVLLETMAGQGTEIGRSFDELNLILQNIDRKDKMGICFDTCHTFAAGYDCSSPRGIEEIIKEIEDTFGQEKVKLVHANDSNTELGSKRDRHAHIGQGFIGSSGFEYLIQNKFFQKLPFILETDPAGVAQDIETLKNMRSKNNSGGD